MKLPVVGKAHEASAAQAPFVWFIYGSSLDAAAFAAWAKEHGYLVPDLAAAIPARLDGYTLAFDVNSRFWGGFVGEPVPAAGRSIEGLALSLPQTARGLVDHKEGAISGLFEPFEAEIAPLAGGAPIRALVYRAVAGRRVPGDHPPAERWLDTVIAGARTAGLSDGWIATLTALRGPA
jgi:gamma-glutamylcyclotransferase